MLSSERSLAMPNGPFTAILARMAWLSLGGALAGALMAVVSGGVSADLPKFYLITQDAPALALQALFFLSAWRWLRAGRATPQSWSLDRLEGQGPVWGLATITLVVAYAGAYLVYRRFALSLDEFMADFDAAIIASGQLLASVPVEWRDYVPALQPMFRLEVPGDAFWVSSYLPVNAAIRAAFLLFGDPALEGAVLAAVALLALFAVARRLWPDRPDAAVVGTLLLACSSQFLITAMTPYAMTAHLALNLVWLWLFLRGTRTSHALAVLVAFAACGLHQVIFHPLFAAPFLLTVLRSRRWKLAAFYAASYAVIGLFWIVYWNLLLHGTGEATAPSADLGVAHQVRRIADMVQLSLVSLPLMGFNLLRFMAWQAPITIPLALLGFIVWRRQGSMVRDLAFGIFLTLAVMLILMPFQGHGWGYRYLHGLLGSVCLLAAQGWIVLTDRGGPVVGRQPARLLFISTALSLCLLFPWFAYQARAFVTPYAAAVAAIGRADADVVVIDPADIWYGIDLVRNDPLFRKRPKVLSLDELDEAGLTKLCRSHDVALFDRRNAAQFGIRLVRSETPDRAAPERTQTLRQLMASLNCGRRAFDNRP